MLISVTAVCTCASPSISYILRCWSPSCARGHSTRLDRGLFCSPPNTDFSLQGKGTFFLIVFIPTNLHPPSQSSWQLPGFRGVKACIIFHQLSQFWYRQKRAAMEQPLRLFAGLNFTDVRLLSFPRPERGAAGMDLQDKCSCVCERESSGTKRPFQSVRWDGESQYYADVKSIKNKSPHAEILSLWCW